MPDPDADGVDLHEIEDECRTFRLSTADLHFDFHGAIPIAVDTGRIQISDFCYREGGSLQKWGVVLGTSGDGFYDLVPVWEDGKIVGWFLALKEPTDEPWLVE